MLDCGHEPSEHFEFTTGYGTDKNGKTSCYACIALSDTKNMIETGNSKNLPLYLVKNKLGKWEVTNWPGSLRFPVRSHTKGYHNIARTREDVWFNGPDGFVWHGVQIGEWTQICHAKRTKERIENAA